MPKKTTNETSGTDEHTIEVPSINMEQQAENPPKLADDLGKQVLSKVNQDRAELIDVMTPIVAELVGKIGRFTPTPAETKQVIDTAHTYAIALLAKSKS